MTAEETITLLELEPHPEGGAFRETYRSKSLAESDPARNACTAIYFLLRARQRTQWHRVRHDEIYHFYHGGSLELSLIDPQGQLSIHRLGTDLRSGERPQIIIPGGYWQSTRTFDQWTLIGCTVSPGFDFQDFELTTPEQLRKQFAKLDPEAIS